MSFTANDFEFYTSFFGLKQIELTSLRQLFQSFPNFDTHKINVLDQSQAVKKLLKSGSRKFYHTWRSYVIEPDRDLDDTECEQLFNEYADVINRIVEPERLFHGQAIDKIMNQYASLPFVVIMDTDIVFTTDKYLPDIISLCNRYSYNELAAIGSVIQKRPFHLTLSPEVSPWFYFKFYPYQSEHIPWRDMLKTAAVNLLKKPSKAKKIDFLGRFPEFYTVLAVINRKIFIQNQMTFRNMYLDVLDIKEGHETKHKILGDNGASFLYQCALAGKKIITIDFNKYIIHKRGTSVSDKKAKGWSWFNEEFSDDPLS